MLFVNIKSNYKKILMRYVLKKLYIKKIKYNNRLRVPLLVYIQYIVFGLNIISISSR